MCGSGRKRTNEANKPPKSLVLFPLPQWNRDRIPVVDLGSQGEFVSQVHLPRKQRFVGIMEHFASLTGTAVKLPDTFTSNPKEKTVVVKVVWSRLIENQQLKIQSIFIRINPLLAAPQINHNSSCHWPFRIAVSCHANIGPF